MTIKPEVVRSLEREQKICSLAIHHLETTCNEFKEKYHWTTEEFLQRFESGSAGDEEDLFRWYAVAKGLAEWESIKTALNEVLIG